VDIKVRNELTGEEKEVLGISMGGFAKPGTSSR
jgi:hypothetical protein